MSEGHLNFSEATAMTANVVAAFASKNELKPSEIPGFIKDVRDALMGNGGTSQAVEMKPAVPPKKSIFPDYIVCLEDGKHFKSLKRHLRAKYNLSPDAYREKWNLPSDYPMVAPNYAKARSELAKQMGLGQIRGGK